MSDTIWTDVNLLTMSETGMSYGLITDAALVEKDGIINWVGNKVDMPAHYDGEIIECSGAYMTPGLIDCHTHFKDRQVHRYHHTANQSAQYHHNHGFHQAG